MGTDRYKLVERSGNKQTRCIKDSKGNNQIKRSKDEEESEKFRLTYRGKKIITHRWTETDAEVENGEKKLNA